MKKLMFAIIACSAMAAVAAVEQGLQDAANDPSVAQMAEEDPDGVQVFADDNGGFKLISCGRGTYDFTDEDEIADAVKEATRNAKAHIAKFFQENFKTSEDAANATKKAKSLHSDGENETVSISKETVKTTVETFHSDAQKVLSGIVVIKQQKVPSSKKGGKVLVTVGWSSLTQKAATDANNGMTDGVNAQRQPGQGTGNGGVRPNGGANTPGNNPTIKRSKGLF
jgi:hypothetical protein